MEELVVEVGLGADGVHSAAVEGADLLDKVLAEGGALLVLLGVVQVDLTQDAQVGPHFGDLDDIGISAAAVHALGCALLATVLLRQHAFQHPTSIILRLREGGADADGDGLGEVGGLAQGGDAAQGAEGEAGVEGIDGGVEEGEVVGDD